MQMTVIVSVQWSLYSIHASTYIRRTYVSVIVLCDICFCRLTNPSSKQPLLSQCLIALAHAHIRTTFASGCMRAGIS